MTCPPAPASAYTAAFRAYVLSSQDLAQDDEAALAWAKARWPAVDFDRICPWRVALWIVSISANDGHEPKLTNPVNSLESS